LPLRIKLEYESSKDRKSKSDLLIGKKIKHVNKGLMHNARGQ
jgi:hypothetical protein